MVGYTEAVNPTLSDTVAEPGGIADAFIMKIAGNAVVVTPAGTVMTFTALPVGSVVPVRILRVNSTGTTANAVGLLYGPRV